jgi:hypothetical protein
MKNSFINILKADFIDDDAIKNWLYCFSYCFGHYYDCQYATLRTKVFRIAALTNEVKELRSEFVDRRSDEVEDGIDRFRKDGRERNFPVNCSSN